jgi:hypothetical protein
LGWSHFVLLLPLEDPLKRDFYAEMYLVERWSVRTTAPAGPGARPDVTPLLRYNQPQEP